MFWFYPDLIVNQTRASSTKVAYCEDLIAPDSSSHCLACIRGGQTFAGSISLASKWMRGRKGQDEGISHPISLLLCHRHQLSSPVVLASARWPYSLGSSNCLLSWPSRLGSGTAVASRFCLSWSASLSPVCSLTLLSLLWTSSSVSNTFSGLFTWLNSKSHVCSIKNNNFTVSFFRGR